MTSQDPGNRTTLAIVVKNAGNTYATPRIKGVQASCTAGPKQAAERFGQKYFGPAYIGVVETTAKANDHSVTTWTVFADAKAYAWCWASGLIEFKGHLPVEEGAVAFASGPKRALERAVNVVSRHGLGASAGKRLVPGIPEAKDQQDGMTALILWVNWCAEGPAAHGVVFSADAEVL
jgi:hypothetical protein